MSGVRYFQDMKKNIIHIVLGVCIFFALAGGGAAVYYWNQFRTTEQMLKNPEGAAKAENGKLISQIAKFMILPDEEPQVATVLDIEKLKDQPFFANAENGDKILVYPKSQKAILYRPSIKKIIDVAPMNIGSPSAETP